MKLIIYAGGLGNQMFQYAFFKAAELSKKKVWSTTAWYSLNNSHNGFELDRLFGIRLKRNFSLPFKINKNTKKDKKEQLKEVSESKSTSFLRSFLSKNPILKFSEYNDASYHPEVLDLKGINVIVGYWQNEKYFKDYRTQILDCFTFPEFSPEETKNIEISEKIKSENSVSIHVRRGDYCGNPWYDGIITTEYYNRAIEYIKSKIENPHFFIFSDDIDWCEKNLNISDAHDFINWNKGSASYRDMQLMSLCKHNIIPNSSFSWWGAWLNNNSEKIVVCPTKWINECSNLDFDDICPSEWVRV